MQWIEQNVEKLKQKKIARKKEAVKKRAAEQAREDKSILAKYTANRDSETKRVAAATKATASGITNFQQKKSDEYPRQSKKVIIP